MPSDMSPERRAEIAERDRQTDPQEFADYTIVHEDRHCLLIENARLLAALDAAEARIGKLSIAVLRALAEVAAAEARARASEAIVANLPRSADGVILHGAMPLWVVPEANSDPCWGFYKRDHADAAPWDGTRIATGSLVWCPAPINGGNYIDIVAIGDGSGSNSLTGKMLHVPMWFCYSTRE